MSGLCDKCGKEYFVSCHDCLHILTMLYHSCKRLLILLPTNYTDERNELLSMKNFYEQKILATSEKTKEV